MVDWKLVPVEPTDGMARACMHNDNGGLVTPEYRKAIYRAMLAAAPQAPSGQQAEPTGSFEQSEAEAKRLEDISGKYASRTEFGEVIFPQQNWMMFVADAATRSALAGQQSERPAPAGAVYLVATGETISGLETYTRHEGAPPPLSHYERLYTAAAPAGQAVGDRWRPEVIAFADAMESKLRQNDWKGGWKDDAPGQLMERVREELAEFETAHVAYPRDTDAYKSNLRDEGADVANMVMMVLDVCAALASQAERPSIKESSTTEDGREGNG